MTMLDGVHPMALALGTLAAFAITGFALQCLWFFVVRPFCRWLGNLGD